MRRKTRAVLLCSGMTCSVVLGCEEQFTPSEVAGTYTLQKVEGHPPPVIILATIECDVSVVSGTLTLTSTGSHEILIDTPMDCTRAGGQVTMSGQTYPGTYELDGDHTIRFRSPVQNGADLVYTGLVAEDRITVTVPDLGGDPQALTICFGR